MKPVAQKNRRIPYYCRENVEMEIKRLLEACFHVDVIEEVSANKPITWISPVVIFPKSGEIRMCIDIWEANEEIDRVRYEIQTVDD